MGCFEAVFGESLHARKLRKQKRPAGTAAARKARKEIAAGKATDMDFDKL